MGEQYFSSNPNSSHHERTITTTLADQAMTFQTDNGVFSKNKIDFGSRVLIDTFLKYVDTLDESDHIVEFGSGYGPIILSIAKAYPHNTCVGLEVNERAMSLAHVNAHLNHLSNVTFQLADLSEDITLDCAPVQQIITNPPIRAGKKTIQKFMDHAYALLAPQGQLWVVIQKKQGAPSMTNYLHHLFGNVECVEKEKGYWILMSRK